MTKRASAPLSTNSSLVEDRQRRTWIGRWQHHELLRGNNVENPNRASTVLHNRPAGTVDGVGVVEVLLPWTARPAGVFTPVDVAAAIGEQPTGDVGHRRSDWCDRTADIGSANRAIVEWRADRLRLQNSRGDGRVGADYEPLVRCHHVEHLRKCTKLPSEAVQRDPGGCLVHTIHARGRLLQAGGSALVLIEGKRSGVESPALPAFTAVPRDTFSSEQAGSDIHGAVGVERVQFGYAVVAQYGVVETDRGGGQLPEPRPQRHIGRLGNRLSGDDHHLICRDQVGCEEVTVPLRLEGHTGDTSAGGGIIEVEHVADEGLTGRRAGVVDIQAAGVLLTAETGEISLIIHELKHTCTRVALQRGVESEETNSEVDAAQLLRTCIGVSHLDGA